MSRRKSDPRTECSNDSIDPTSSSMKGFPLSGDGSAGDATVAAAAAATCIAEPGNQFDGIAESKNLGSQPTLDSLLASCGALRVVLRDSAPKDFDTVQCSNAESRPETRDSSAESFHDSDAVDSASLCSHPALTPIQPDLTKSGADSSLIDLLRQEFRASIDELKATHAAAAEGQSAVLKTLTEIIFQSSAMRDNGGGDMEERLAALEDRIVNRITHVRGLTHCDVPSAQGFDAGMAAPESTGVGNSGSQSWVEIRRDLVSRGGASVDGESTRSGNIPVRLNAMPSNLAEPNATIEVPRAIDPETLNLQELRAVFYERESFISTLIGRLRHVHQKGNVRLPAEELRQMADLLPDELSAEVVQALAKLDEISRIGELELSLERARLARQVNQLDNSRQLIEHNARQLGLQLADDGTLLNPQKLTLNNNGTRRWLSKLGFGA